MPPPAPPPGPAGGRAPPAPPKPPAGPALASKELPAYRASRTDAAQVAGAASMAVLQGRRPGRVPGGTTLAGDDQERLRSRCRDALRPAKALLAGPRGECRGTVASPEGPLPRPGPGRAWPR